MSDTIVWKNTSDEVVEIGEETWQPGECIEKQPTFAVNDHRIIPHYLWLTKQIHELKQDLPLTVDEKGELDEISKSLLAKEIVARGLDQVAVAVAKSQTDSGKLRTVTEKYVTELVAAYKG